MRLCIFEDRKFDQLYPLTYLRPAFELKCGHTNLREKIVRQFRNAKVTYFMRDCLVDVFKNRLAPAAINDLNGLRDNDILMINGRVLLVDAKIEQEGPEEVGLYQEEVVYIRSKKETVTKHLADNIDDFTANLKNSLPAKKISATLINYPWDLVNNNPKAITDDFKHLDKADVIEGKLSPQATIYGDKNGIYIAKGVEVHPFVVLDTRNGPVIIDEGTQLHPFTRVEGPSAIGKDCQILGAKIREGTSLGPVCRVGGEVEESIIHGFSNKYHDGFLGHSYVCEWVNLGALTTNSDLKNDYGGVMVYIKGEFVDSRAAKVGSFIGDHTKTSIGTLLNTGTVLGVMCNIVGGDGILPKFVPSFSWVLNRKVSKGYGFKMLVETAKYAMSRRGKELTAEDLKLLEVARELTKAEREELVKRARRED